MWICCENIPFALKMSLSNDLACGDCVLILTFYPDKQYATITMCIYTYLHNYMAGVDLLAIMPIYTHYRQKNHLLYRLTRYHVYAICSKLRINPRLFFGRQLIRVKTSIYIFPLVLHDSIDSNIIISC